MKHNTIYWESMFVQKYADLWFAYRGMEPYIDEFVRMLPCPGEVLDVGCGPGRDVLALTNRGIETVGIDVSHAMLTEALIHVPTHVPTPVFRQMDLRRLRYPPDTFSGIWSCASLHHLPVHEAALTLEEFARVLRSDGVLYLAVEQGEGESVDSLGRYRKLYTQREIESLLISAGFDVISNTLSVSDRSTIERDRPKTWFNLLARTTVEDLPDPDCRWKTDCLFCPNLRFQVNRELKLPGASSILWGDDDLYVVPDVAPLVEGHLLIISTDHHICFGACPESTAQALDAARRFVRRLFREVYQVDPLFVEHGPTRCYKAGACINHAHLHCLPVTLPVRDCVESRLGGVMEATIETLRTLYQSGTSYIYLENGDDQGWAYPTDNLPSQFLRQTVTSLLGRNDKQWQVSCHRHEVQDVYHRTLRRLLPIVDRIQPPSEAVARDDEMTTLNDLGEHRIVRELIEPRFPTLAATIVGIGDDCAVLPAPPHDHVLVLTTDPCPTPVVCQIESPDYYHYGRLTAVVNVSDLAAMGATPVGIVVATVMPNDMRVRDYERFLDGLAEACREWSCPVVGGNIKDGPEFTANSSALGFVRASSMLRRTGTKPGDHVCVIGEMGLFWAAVLARREPGVNLDRPEQDALDRALYQPVARIREGMALAATGQVSACMDSSDGVIACLRELALVNHADLVIASDALIPHPAVRRVAEAVKIDHRKLMLAWGNWELVCSIPAEAVAAIRSLITSLGTTFSDIGVFSLGTGQVWLEEDGQRSLLANFASERFSSTSTFTHGLDAYQTFLQREPLSRQPQP